MAEMLTESVIREIIENWILGQGSLAERWQALSAESRRVWATYSWSCRNPDPKQIPVIYRRDDGRFHIAAKIWADRHNLQIEIKQGMVNFSPKAETPLSP